jgi:hypothetical protein
VGDFDGEDVFVGIADGSRVGGIDGAADGVFDGPNVCGTFEGNLD